MSAYRTATVTFYRNDMGLIDVEVPATNYDAAKRIVEEQLNVKPVYKKFDGWKSKTQGIKKFEDLPEKAKTYVKAIEQFIETRISSISTSPERA